MAVLATDDFNRANTSSLGANWGNVTGAAPWGISSNKANDTNAGITVNRYTAVTAPADQYSKCTVVTLVASTGSGVGPAVRMASGAVTMYLLQANTIETTMFKGVAGSFTQLGVTASGSVANDVLEISAVGTTITGKRNGVTIIGPVTDSAIASGDWGIWGVSGTVELDNWEGGDTAAVTVTVNLTGVGASPAVGTLTFNGSLNVTGLAATPAIGAGTVSIAGSVVTPPAPVLVAGGRRLYWLEDETVRLEGVAATPEVGRITPIGKRTQGDIERAFPFPKPEVPQRIRRVTPKPVLPSMFVYMAGVNTMPKVGTVIAKPFYEDIDEELVAIVQAIA